MWPPLGAENNSRLGPRLHLPVWGSGANLTAGWTHLEGVLAAERRPRHCCCCRGLTWWPRAVAVRTERDGKDRGSCPHASTGSLEAQSHLCLHRVGRGPRA